MAYRNGTYVAFDGNGQNDPTKGDLKYLGILRAWKEPTILILILLIVIKRHTKYVIQVLRQL